MNSLAGGDKGFYLIVSAPSGAGKTTICKRILEMFPGIKYSVSYTTRPPRQGEENGKDYHFVADEDFRRGIAAGRFAEWSENFGHLYGTSLDAMKKHLDQGLDLILDVEINGAKAIKESFNEGVSVFIMPPSMEELRRRLIERGFTDPHNLQRRISEAMDMIKTYQWYDYVVVNDNLDDAVDRLRSIYIAEKCRRERWEGRLKRFIEEVT